MNMTKRRLFTLGVCVVGGALAAASVRADVPLPSLDAGDLAKGPYSAMHMLLQKTILKVNVATIDVRFDKATQARFAALARGQGYSEALSHQLAGTAFGAGRAVVQMQFVRDVPFNRWLGVVKDNVEQARKAGLIGKDLEERVNQGLPEWFGALKKRGYEKGDKLIYSITPDALRSVVVAANGQVYVDMIEKDPGGRRVVLASYFAPGSEFREPLLRSLVEGR
jgi:hypothetical protein